MPKMRATFFAATAFWFLGCTAWAGTGLRLDLLLEGMMHYEYTAPYQFTGPDHHALCFRGDVMDLEQAVFKCVAADSHTGLQRMHCGTFVANVSKGRCDEAESRTWLYEALSRKTDADFRTPASSSEIRQCGDLGLQVVDYDLWRFIVVARLDRISDVTKTLWTAADPFPCVHH